ncbi:hypothetical protein L195_g014550 [Trifolium pratense]|uniref:Uncharacterized protein n=2 Tax=Trifolium pratense TaxID=57577 RepID=A0A2K3PR81_TRIPR|nr:hypothetical protein L195_g014550 [Trifolium pratense]CAJ2668440.1 unnamed protein product [Trifolium pratense]
MSATRRSSAANSGSDSEINTFVNSDVADRFVTIFSSKSFHSERGFIFNTEKENLGLPERFAKLIEKLKWKKLA